MTRTLSPVRLCQRDTPLEPMHRLRKLVGGPHILIKRDDCTGLALGGNKSRKLEYLLAEALREKADVVVTGGALQSNHVRQTAAAAAHLGLDCHVVLERRIVSPGVEYETSGNLLLDRLFGAIIHDVPPEASPAATLDGVAGQLGQAGRRVYVVPPGGSSTVGARGYIDCAGELIAQAAELGRPLDLIIHPTNSGGTQAGLVAGLSERGSDARVLGVSVGRDQAAQEAIVRSLADAIAEESGLDADLGARVRVDDRFVGPGYGQLDGPTLDAIRTVAEYEGILLDPVYTGKAMACLLDLIRTDNVSSSSTVVFLHTGGAPGLFAYASVLNEQLHT